MDKLEAALGAVNFIESDLNQASEILQWEDGVPYLMGYPITPIPYNDEVTIPNYSSVYIPKPFSSVGPTVGKVTFLNRDSIPGGRLHAMWERGFLFYTEEDARAAVRALVALFEYLVDAMRPVTQEEDEVDEETLLPIDSI